MSRRSTRNWECRWPAACCGINISERSAYYIDDDATPRCWKCHCIALGVWSERGPTVALDEEGRIIGDRQL